MLCLAFNKSIEQEWIRRAIAGPSAPTFPLTDEQQAIIAHCLAAKAAGQPIRLNILARAGSGKTFILFEALRSIGHWPDGELASGRTGSYLRSSAIKTSHALGLAAWKAKGLTVSVFPGKDRALAKELGLYKQPLSPDDSRPVAPAAIALAAKAKTVGISPSDRGRPLLADTDAAWADLADHFGLAFSPAILAAARTLLALSIDRGKQPHNVTLPGGKRTLRSVVELDFADMIYLPVLFSAPFERQDLILLDEEQDFSPLRAEVVYRCCTSRTSVIGAGDPAQAIYAFTGADTRAMTNISDRLGLTTLPLSISQRCSAAVIAAAQRIVPDIKARPGAPAGTVSTQPPDDGWTVSALPSTILCRNNAPLIALAIHALTQRRPVALLGRDDILPQLEDLYTAATGQAADSCTIAQFYTALQAHLQALIRRAKRLPPATRDNAAALLALAQSIEQERGPGARAAEILTILSSLYPAEEALARLSPATLLLSTIHKSKGLEWPAVGILDPGLIGAFAKQDWEQEAESNLHYVGITRAIDALHYIDSGDIAGFSGRVPSVDVPDEPDEPDDAPAPEPPALLF